MIKNKDFNILFSGRLLANFGDSLYGIATMLLIYHLTGSTLYSGLALALTSSVGIVQIVISPIFNKINMKKMLIYLQLLQAILLLFIPILHTFGELTIGKILLIMPLVTLLNQLIYPAQITLLPRILEGEEQLLRGNTLFTIAYQGSDALFNAFAGVIISLLGIYTVYFLNSVTFFINALLFISLASQLALPLQQNTSSRKSFLKQYKSDFKEGLMIWKNRLLLSLLVGVMAINFATTSIFANLPAFSRSTLHYGFLMAASGLGVLIGGLLLSKFQMDQLKLNKIYIYSVFCIGAFWSIASLITDLSILGDFLIVICFFIGWIPVGLLNILSQTIIQLTIPKEKMGSAMSSMIGLSIVFAPIGALFGGYLGELFDPSQAILFSSLIFLIIGVYWISQKTIRQLSNIELIAKSS